MNLERLDPYMPAPSYAHPGDAGLDLHAVGFFRITRTPKLIPTGIKVAIPDGHVGLVCPRSGLAAKHGVTVTNAPGVIDAGYRGEVKVVLHHQGAEGDAYFLSHGERCAQLLIVPIARPEITVVDTLDATERGADGFGSTGR
ncbi:dUTP diphosphatase [Kocuria sp.]|uniref:dUTP diphosphatase n=1 Tax=Kocuria sp. TaxID=1871328 RepID=UPI0026DDA0F4|nr:dUTP diphosphatase [Kocuria sp.]MDO4919917.1 dUTP diphosphatase [Kocuria sp.]